MQCYTLCVYAGSIVCLNISVIIRFFTRSARVAAERNVTVPWIIRTLPARAQCGVWQQVTGYGGNLAPATLMPYPSRFISALHHWRFNPCYLYGLIKARLCPS